MFILQTSDWIWTWNGEYAPEMVIHAHKNGSEIFSQIQKIQKTLLKMVDFFNVFQKPNC